MFGRETGVPDREIFFFFLRQKIFNFSVKNCYLQHRRSLYVKCFINQCMVNWR